MPTNKKQSRSKGKASARAHANERTHGRVRTPRSTKQISQSRFPGETPLTGEDRPVDREGNKQTGHRQLLNNPELRRNYHPDEPQFRAPAPKRRPVAKNRRKPHKPER